MSRPRSRLPWRYDDASQSFTTPAGVVTLHELAALRYGLATSHIDLAAPWAGWKLRGAMLIAPGGGARIRPEIAAQFGRWLREMDARDAAAFGSTAPRERKLYLVK